MKSLKLALLAGAFFAAASTTTQAQSLDDIVKKHNAAIGGEEAWAKVNSFKAEGTVTLKAQSVDMIFRMAFVKDKIVRQEQEAMGQSFVFVLGPTGGWQSNGSKTEDIPAEKAEKAYSDMAGELAFTDDLMEAAQKKYKMELQGKEKVNGKDAFKISVIDNDADETIYFVDAASYQIIRDISKTEVEGEEVDKITDYSDFKKIEPLGLTIAMTEDNPETTQKIKKVELNKLTEDDALFKKPAK